MAEFAALLGAFVLADNAARNAAEARFAELREGAPDECMNGLVSVLRTADDPVMRSMAAVLIRRVLTEGEASASLWGRMSEAMQRQLQAELLKHLEEENEPSIRNKTVHTTALIGMITLEDGKWPELMPYIHSIIHHETAEMRIVALALFEQLAYYIASCMEDHFPGFVGVFMDVLSDEAQPLRVHIGATRASVALVVSIERPSQLPPFSPLVPHWINVLHAALNAGDKFSSNETLSVLIDVADVAAAVFKPSLQDVVAAALSIANTEEVPTSTRHLALELVTRIAQQVPYLLRKIPGNWFLMTGLPVVFGLMMDSVEDPEWEMKTADDENRDERNVVVGEDALDRWSNAIGQELLVPVVEGFVAELLTHEEWQHRHAGLMALSQVVDTIDATTEKLDELTDQILPFFHDAHPRVRHAAVDAMGMLADSQAPGFQKQCGHRVLPAFIYMLTLSESPRGVGHTAEALVNYLEMADPDDLAPHLDELVSALGNALVGSPPRAKSHVVFALSALADTCEDAFAPYYDALGDALKDIITTFTDYEHRELRGRAFECLTTVGGAAGAERFHDDAIAIMEMLLGEFKNAAGEINLSLEEDDAQRKYMWQAFGRIAKVLGDEFVPYLDIVLPSLLAGAANQSEMIEAKEGETDADIWGGDAPDSDEEDEQLETARRGKVKFFVKTAALADKSEALRMLTMFAGDMVEAFLPYVEQTAAVALPLIEIEGEAYDDVKSYAMCILPDLIKSAVREIQLCEQAGTEPRCGVAFVNDLFETVLEACLRRLGLETDMELIMTLVQTIKISVENVSEVPPTPAEEEAALAVGGKAMPSWRPVLTADQMGQVTRTVLGALQRSLQRRATRHAMATVDHEEIDDTEMERIHMKDQREGEMQFYCADVIGTLAKTHGNSYLPVFETFVMEKVQDLCHPRCQPSDRKLGLFLIDDLLEHTGPGVVEAGWMDLFMPMVLQGVEAEDAEVQQAAVYGIGSAASTTGAAFAPYARAAADALAGVISNPDMRRGQDESVHDNAVSALGKLILLQSDTFDSSDAVPFFISTFPLKYDRDESRVATQQLCTLICNGNPHVFGESGSALPAALAALASVCRVETVITQRLVIRIVSVLRALQVSLPGETLERVWGALDAGTREVLESILADPAMEAVKPAEMASSSAGFAAAGAGGGS